MKIFILRIQKWFYQKVLRHKCIDLPFDIAYTDISDSYSDYPPGINLAEFNCNNKHYLIYIKDKYLI